jgi:hypothetical protein
MTTTEAEGVAALLGDGSAGAAAEGGAAADAGKPAAPAGDSWWSPLGISAEKAEGRLSDAEWLQNKNYGGLPDLIKSTRELEGKVGSKLVAPTGPDDKEGWAALGKALGVPDSPDGYQIEMKGVQADDELLKGYAAKAHELGIPPHMTQALAAWLGDSLVDQANSNATKAKAELQTEWKGEYDANLELGRRAMGTLGLTPDDVNQMAAGFGLARTMQLLARVGKGISEDGGLPGRGSGAQTPEQMAARKQEIIKSPELSKKLREGDATLKAEWDRIIAAEAAALEKGYGRAA